MFLIYSGNAREADISANYELDELYAFAAQQHRSVATNDSIILKPDEDENYKMMLACDFLLGEMFPIGVRHCGLKKRTTSKANALHIRHL